MTPSIPMPTSGGRTKFLIGGLLIIGAIIYLVITTMRSTQQFFYTVQEMQAKGSSVIGKNLRVSGAVLGDTIQFDDKTLTVSFMMANISGKLEDVNAQALHLAALDTTSARVKVVYIGPKPDLLKHEAQAIVTGQLGEDGVFYADELLLKCPTRYEEQGSLQAQGN